MKLGGRTCDPDANWLSSVHYHSSSRWLLGHTLQVNIKTVYVIASKLTRLLSQIHRWGLHYTAEILA
jgi:hypothetical protein